MKKQALIGVLALCLVPLLAGCPKYLPEAAFAASPVEGVAPLTVQFTDQSVAEGDEEAEKAVTITSWAWNFGDGATSIAQNPVHAYTAPGAYSVSLKVVTKNGEDTETKTNYITVRASVAPEAAFTVAPTSGLAPLTVQFTDISVAGSSEITSWAWLFGDGGSSTLQNPTHLYNAAGTYTVSLSITTAHGADTETKTGCVVVNPKIAPTAAFTAAPTTGQAPMPVQFTDQSTAGTAAISSWSWNFGDGKSTSSEQSPQHVYDAVGIYTVSLTVTSAHGTDSETKTNLITLEPGRGNYLTQPFVPELEGKMVKFLVNDTIPDYYVTQIAKLPAGADANFRVEQFAPGSSLADYTPLDFTAGDPVEVNLLDDKKIWLYGHVYDTVYVSGDGRVTMADTTGTSGDPLGLHFAVPGVSGLFAPFDSADAVYAIQLDDRLVVIYDRVNQTGLDPADSSNSFQVELFFEGLMVDGAYLDAAISWFNVDNDIEAITGVSDGSGEDDQAPADYEASDLLSTAAGGQSTPTDNLNTPSAQVDLAF